MKYRKLPLELIDMGVRFRQDIGDITSLKASIAEKGLIQPITVSPNGERFTLISGGRRLTACTELEMKTVPAMVREIEDELDLREMELIENTHRQDMTWQEKFPLIKQVHDLQIEKYGGNATQRRSEELMGFKRSYLSKVLKVLDIIEHVPELLEEQDHQDVIRKYNRLIEKAITKRAVREGKENLVTVEEGEGPKTERELKEHRKNLFLSMAEDSYNVGDAIEMMRGYKGEVACFAEVDPPYAVDLNQLRENKGADTPNIDEYNEVSVEEYPQFLLDTATQVYRLLKNDTFCIWWHGSIHHQLVLETLEGVGFNVDRVPAIWHKSGAPGNILNPEASLARQYEPFFVCKKGKPKLREFPMGNVFSEPGLAATARIHPTERPIQLIRKLLKTFTRPEKNAHVLVPFLGSGATLRAAFMEGFKAWGYDLSDGLKTDYLTKIRKELDEGIYNV